MRINDKQFITADQGEKAAENRKTEARQAVRKGNQAAASVSGQAADTVALSNRARDIAEIASQLKQSSEVREELVTEIRERIKDGTYSVSGFDIAAAILRKAEEGIF